MNLWQCIICSNRYLSCRVQCLMQVYPRLNHVGVYVGYTAKMKLVEVVSQLFTLQRWITEDVIFKFWGDNLDQKRGFRDVPSDH